MVNEIENDIESGKEKYYYLSGLPGSGKTNIISRLCCKNASLIDIRYYAFEPIDPEKEYFASDVSHRVNKDVFWNALLNRLRELLKGKLYKYKVPVSNSFLTLQQKRSHFFRIVDEYTKDENRTFVIVIDGIDHAARAGAVDDTFLSTLPHPEYIPERAKIIISGQPKDKYEYPLWLYQNLTSVKEYNVPPIQQGDVFSLVDSRCHHLDNADKNVFSRIICQYAEGNTLAAVFASYEALACDNPIDFEKRLQARKLSGNIQEYYLSIWNGAKQQMQVSFVDYKMAGTFAFINEPVSGKTLNQIFPQEQISVSNWNSVLKALSPLLNECNGSYSVLHNDVRVFLSGIIGVDQNQVKEVYSNLSDYYIHQKDKTHGYYSDVIRFLVAAGRIQEFDLVYSPSFLLSAYVEGIELGELRQTTNNLLNCVIDKSNLDWNKLSYLAVGYLTLDQIEKSAYEIGDANFRKVNKHIGTHPYECFVSPIEKWNSQMLQNVLNLIDELCNSGDLIRGKSVFMNWFSGVDILAIKTILDNGDEEYYSSEEKTVSKLLAKAIVRFGEYSILSEIDKTSYADDKFLSLLITNTEDEIFQSLSDDDFMCAYASLKVHSIDSLILGMKRKIENNQFEDIKSIKVVLEKESIDNSLSKLLLAFIKIISGDSIENENWVSQLCEDFNTIVFPEMSYDVILSYYAIYAIVYSYLRLESRSSIAENIANRYMRFHKNENHGFMSLFFNSACYLGKWLKATNNNSLFLESADDLGKIIKNLYCKQWKPNERGFESQEIDAYILKAFILLSRKEDSQFQSTVNVWFEQVFQNHPVNQFLDPGILFYNNNTVCVQEWVDEWLNENGRVWDEEIGCRNSILKKFHDVLTNYEMISKVDLRGAIERAQWSVIGFASNNEYSVRHLLNCYRSLVQFDSQNINCYAQRVKEISDIIDRLGDNRVSYEVDTQFYSDIGSLGFIAIKNLLCDNRFLSQGFESASYMVDILIGYLKTQVLSRQQIISVWSLGLGFLDWRNEADHASIISLENAVILCAERNELPEIKSEISKISPAYVGLHADPVKYIIPDRWCDKKTKITEPEEANKIVMDYINDASDKKAKHIVADALASLYSVGMLQSEIVATLLNRELSDDVYSINHNSICEFLIGIGTDRIVDREITAYITKALEKGVFYPEQDLPEIISWRCQHKEEQFAREYMTLLIDMYDCWITAANHIKSPAFSGPYDYKSEIKKDSSSVIELYVQLLMLIIMSEDADASRVALGGVAALLRIDTEYVTDIELFWEQLHYRAKEWILMVYEFVCWVCPASQQTMLENILRHVNDDDCNVALYAKLLCESISPENVSTFHVAKKEFFDDIPKNGVKRFIKRNTTEPWVTGYDYVLKQIERLNEFLPMDLSDIERRTAEYSASIDWDSKLLPLHRNRVSWCKTVCDKVNVAFFRVLYKDWFEGRWEDFEVELAKSVLSASEPFCFLCSPAKWMWNNGILFDNLKDILGQPEIVRNTTIRDVLNNGIDNGYMVLAGAVEDYTYNTLLHGCMISHFDIPGIEQEDIFYNIEYNSRIFLQNRGNYNSIPNANVTQVQSGIESFKQSNMMCGFSEFVLSLFDWKVTVQSDGIKLVQSDGKEIGRFEHYYGIRTDIGNREVSNQPYLQRWIVKTDELDKAIAASGCPYKIKTITKSVKSSIF